MWRRNKLYVVRSTEFEEELVKGLAKKANLSVTEYMLRCAASKKINVIDIKPLYVETKRIGGNIHQIAKLANFGKIEAVNLEGVQDELSKIYDELQNITKRCS